MKKLLLTIGCAALLGMGIVAVSCKKEKSDFDKGKEAGQSYCDCIKKAGEDVTASLGCLSKVDLTAGEEYQKGFVEGGKACLTDED